MLTRIEELEKQAKEFMEEVAKIKSQYCDAKDSKVKLSELKLGETFKIGDHDFIVLDHYDLETKVISKDFWGKGILFGDTKDYRKSNLKDFIEKEIQPVIENAVGKDNLVEHLVDLTALDGGNDFGNLLCKVHPIEFMELREYPNLLVNKDLGNYWWTVTPWNSADKGYRNGIAVVSPSGNFNYYFYDFHIGVRPVCILKSDIFVSR